MQQKHAKLGHEKGTKNFKNFKKYYSCQKQQFVQEKYEICTLWKMRNMPRSHIHIKLTRLKDKIILNGTETASRYI